MGVLHCRTLVLKSNMVDRPLRHKSEGGILYKGGICTCGIGSTTRFAPPWVGVHADYTRVGAGRETALLELLARELPRPRLRMAGGYGEVRREGQAGLGRGGRKTEEGGVIVVMGEEKQ